MYFCHQLEMYFPWRLTCCAHGCVLECRFLVVHDSYYGCVRHGDGHDVISVGPIARLLSKCLVSAGRTVPLIRSETVLAHGHYLYVASSYFV